MAGPLDAAPFERPPAGVRDPDASYLDLPFAHPHGLPWRAPRGSGRAVFLGCRRCPGARFHVQCLFGGEICTLCGIRHWSWGSPCSGASLNWTTERRDHILFKTEQPHHILIEPATSPCKLVVRAVPLHVPHQE